MLAGVPDEELHFVSATWLAEAIRTGEVSSSEVVAHGLA
jgi:hypothetical protein